jgi:hypothetical protein
MQSSGDFARGATITVTVVFKDAGGNPVDPAGANVVLAYDTAAGRTKQTIAMSSGSNHQWTATWDSSLTVGGTVDGEAITTGSPPTSAENFFFTINTNSANKP